MKIKKELVLNTGYSHNFGIKDANEIESYAKGIKIIDEWSFVDDPDTRSKIMKYLRMTRTQWTVTATINK
jgi:hypothetical protein